MQDNLKQIIIHELGHYVARELNFKLFNIGEGVEKILILTKNQIPYEGRATAIKPKNYSNPSEVINKAEYIAVLVYGCMFEAIFAKEHFIYFFKERCSGERDYLEYNSLLKKYFDDDIKIDLICYLRDEYFILLVENSSHFDYLFNMNFDELIITMKDENYEINLALLKEEITIFLESHKIFYKSCVSEISRILTIDGVES